MGARGGNGWELCGRSVLTTGCVPTPWLPRRPHVQGANSCLHTAALAGAQYVDVKDPIPDLNTQAVFQYLLITNQVRMSNTVQMGRKPGQHY